MAFAQPSAFGPQEGVLARAAAQYALHQIEGLDLVAKYAAPRSGPSRSHRQVNWANRLREASGSWRTEFLRHL